MFDPKMPAERYHGTMAISASMLKMARNKTLAHVYDALTNPKEPTEAMRFGTIMHTAVLEPGLFDERYMVMPEGLDRRTKEGKETWAAIQATGKECLPADKFETVKKIMAAVHESYFWQAIEESDPIIESSIFQTSDDGLMLKCRTDIFVKPCVYFPKGAVIDFKTTSDASPEGFGNQVYKLGYHLQAAYYTQMTKSEFSLPERPVFYLLAAETSSPYLTAPYRVTDEQIQMGDHEISQIMPALIEAMRTNVWPGYHTEPIDLELPNWAYNEFEDELTVTTEE